MDTKKKIVVLGGNRYNLPVIQNIQEQGFHAIVIDKLPTSPSFSIADSYFAIDILDVENIIIALSKIENILGVVSMAEVGIVPAQIIAERLNLKGHSQEVASNVTDKGRMRTCWKKIPQHSVKFEIATSLDEGKALLNTFDLPVIIKPTLSFGGSRGVMIIYHKEEFENAYANAKSGGTSKTNVLIEQVVSGREFSAEVLINKGITSVLCIGEKIKSDFPYRVDMSIMYPAPLQKEIEKEIHKAIGLAVNSLGLEWGVAHVEFCLTHSNEIVFFELGARCGGGHTPLIAKYVSGVDEFGEYCRLSCNMEAKHFYPTYQKGAIYRFIIFDEGEVEEVIYPEGYKDDSRILDFDILVKKGDKIPALTNTSARSGFLITKGDSMQEALQLADEICKKIIIVYSDKTVGNARIS